jgi:hypothetical protein
MGKIWIRDGKKFRSGIWDKHPGSATLVIMLGKVESAASHLCYIDEVSCSKTIAKKNIRIFWMAGTINNLT